MTDIGGMYMLSLQNQCFWSKITIPEVFPYYEMNALYVLFTPKTDGTRKCLIQSEVTSIWALVQAA